MSKGNCLFCWLVMHLQLCNLRTFAPKSSHAQIFLKLSLQVEKLMIKLDEKRKKMGGHRTRF